MSYILNSTEPSTCHQKQTREYYFSWPYIPGPHKPWHDINPFLEPFVDELLKFWSGIELSVSSLGRKKKKFVLFFAWPAIFPLGGRCADFWVTMPILVAHDVIKDSKVV